MCDFNGQDYCNSWYQVTNVTDYHERLSEPTTVAPLNKLNEVPLHLFRLQSPSAKIKEAMRGSGNMLVFDHKPNPLTRRTSALVSPELPRTNPEAYDEKSPLFKSCKVSFNSFKKFLKFVHITNLASILPLFANILKSMANICNIKRNQSDGKWKNNNL